MPDAPIDVLDETLTPERFAKVRSLYVVLTFRGEAPSWWDWLLWPESRWGDRMPRQVPNDSMEWRRPTYAEVVTRQEAFTTREDWTDLVNKYMALERRCRLAVPEREVVAVDG